MFCIHCGAETAEKARFCNKCGAFIEDIPDQAISKSQLTDVESTEKKNEKMQDVEDSKDKSTQIPPSCSSTSEKSVGMRGITSGVLAYLFLLLVVIVVLVILFSARPESGVNIKVSYNTSACKDDFPLLVSVRNFRNSPLELHMFYIYATQPGRSNWVRYDRKFARESDKIISRFGSSSGCWKLPEGWTDRTEIAENPGLVWSALVSHARWEDGHMYSNMK